MELFFRRPRQQAVIAAVTALPEDAVLCISMLSVSTLFYFVEKAGIDAARAHKFLQNYTILDAAPADYEWATDNDAGDFEDALQISCACRSGCGSFMTLDQKVGAMYGRFLPVTTVR